MSALLDLAGRVAVVTGGGTGIGARTAALLAEHGAAVVLAGRSADTLEATGKAILARPGGRALAVPADVRREEDVARLVERAVEAFGRLDLLVNNAGGTSIRPLKDVAPERWERILDLNLTSAYRCARAAYPHLRESDGAAIVNISSVAGVQGVKGGAAYASAKAGLQMLTRVTAAEWGPHGIRCNAVAVGGIATDAAVEAWRRYGQTPEALGARVPLRRIGLPDDVARAVLFLVAPMSSWVTGQTLAVDGGPTHLGGMSDEDL